MYARSALQASVHSKSYQLNVCMGQWLPLAACLPARPYPLCGLLAIPPSCAAAEETHIVAPGLRPIQHFC